MGQGWSFSAASPLELLTWVPLNLEIWVFEVDALSQRHNLTRKGHVALWMSCSGRQAVTFCFARSAAGPRPAPAFQMATGSLQHVLAALWSRRARNRAHGSWHASCWSDGVTTMPFTGMGIHHFGLGGVNVVINPLDSGVFPQSNDPQEVLIPFWSKRPPLQVGIASHGSERV